MNKSKKYVMLKSTNKRQPESFKRVDWINGEVEEMLNFLRIYYKTNLNQEMPIDLPVEDGLILLYDYVVKMEKLTGEKGEIPIKLFYDPDAKFNSFGVTPAMEGGAAELDVKYSLISSVINLRLINKTEAKKVVGLPWDKIRIYAYVGDIVSGISPEGVKMYALPVQFKVFEE